MKNYYVYILTNRKKGILYTGVTNNLERRVFEHKNQFSWGFTSRFGVNQLVYYELHQDIREAIKREKLIKKWKRSWKMNLIEKENSIWEDLARDW